MVEGERGFGGEREVGRGKGGERGGVVSKRMCLKAHCR